MFTWNPMGLCTGIFSPSFPTVLLYSFKAIHLVHLLTLVVHVANSTYKCNMSFRDLWNALHSTFFLIACLVIVHNQKSWVWICANDWRDLLHVNSSNAFWWVKAMWTISHWYIYIYICFFDFCSFFNDRQMFHWLNKGWNIFEIYI